MSIYVKVIKPVFFLIEPERMHNIATFYGRILGSNILTRTIMKAMFHYENPMLSQTIEGIRFNNPIGLPAGFDKDCKLMKVLPCVGFGFEEVGSITALPYEGNPKPRLKRLPKDRSIIVYYGLKNKGAVFLKNRLKRRFKFPIGVSIAKTNKYFRSDKEKISDWVKGVRILKGVGDYITINLSCPNTSDTKSPQEPRFLQKLLKEMNKLNIRKPVFLKVSADMSREWADEMIKISDRYGFVKGFIISNLCKDRRKLKLRTSKKIVDKYKGGISGRPIQKMSNDLLRYFYKKTKGRYVLIGCGGIFSARDAYEKIKNGASLVQMVTGMIYEGPFVIKRIKKGLVNLLKKDGYKNISEAVGKDVR